MEPDSLSSGTVVGRECIRPVVFGIKNPSYRNVQSGESLTIKVDEPIVNQLVTLGITQCRTNFTAKIERCEGGEIKLTMNNMTGVALELKEGCTLVLVTSTYFEPDQMHRQP